MSIGVGIGSLYDYFANREGLLGAFLSRVTEKNFEALEREVMGTRSMKFDEALPLIVDAVLRTYLEKPARTRAVSSSTVCTKLSMIALRLAIARSASLLVAIGAGRSDGAFMSGLPGER